MNAYHYHTWSVYILTVVLQWLVWRKYFDWRIWASLVPIVGGILLTSITELNFNMLGFCAALFGCLATSTKTILAESLLHGYKFDRYWCYSWDWFFSFWSALIFWKRLQYKTTGLTLSTGSMYTAMEYLKILTQKFS